MRQKIRTGLLLGMFCLFPAVYYYMSPYLIIEGTAQGIVTGSFLLFLFMFLSSMIFGRLYCGWLCPAAGIQEVMFPANGRKIRRGNFIKWIFWIIWLDTIILVAVKNRGYHSIDPFYKTFHGLSVNDDLPDGSAIRISPFPEPNQ